MPRYDDTTAYPAFSGATAKRDMLRFLWSELEPNTPNFEDVVYRVNNSDLSALPDGSSIYNPASTFGGV